jgi:hypothetical protein
MANPTINTRGDLPTVNVDTGGTSSFPDTAVPSDAVTNAKSLTAIAGWIHGYDGFTWNRVRTGLTGSTSGSLGMINSAITMATGSLSVLPIGKFNSVKPSLLDTQFAEAQFTSRGAMLIAPDELPQAQDDTNQVLWEAPRPLSTGTAGQILLWADYVAAATSGVIKASPGRLYVVMFQSRSSSERFIQFYNSTTVPVDTTVPVITVAVPAGGVCSIDLNAFGRYFSTGIAWAVSTTMATKTIGAAEIIGNVGYI